jgi:vancomycin resistance protein YoaR
LVFVYSPPEFPDTTSAEELGISELIHAESTYFYGSSQSRIHNIEISANRFHGLLIAPGETLSMASALGEVSLDSGYAEALIIYNGRTIKGVGGGVCQVSTTLFRTAFFYGFPIIERQPHAYRVSFYEKTQGNYHDPNLAGLDATVYVPIVDLKFTNDTPYWLLMETYVNRQASRLTWKFYSTSDGRSIDWQTSGPINIVKPPKPYYKVNPELDQGEIKQVDWEAEGADVRVKRWVYRDWELYFKDNFFTHYEPWRAVYEYGPGTTGIPEQEEP